MRPDKPGKLQREIRKEARWKIIQMANRHKMRCAMRRGYTPTMFGARHVQQAVAVCRRANLLKPEVYVAAGFNDWMFW